MSISKAIRAFVSVIVASCVSAAGAGVINVSPGVDTIQPAIDAASDGDEIVASPGLYIGLINFKGKAITRRSIDPLNPQVVADTIIDGAGSVVTCNTSEGPDTVLAGCTITGGDATAGGGMFNSTSDPTVIHRVFSGNTAGSGGGVSSRIVSKPTVRHRTSDGNRALNSGGGVFSGGKTGPATTTVTNCILVGEGGLGKILLSTNADITSFSDVYSSTGGSVCSRGPGSISVDPPFPRNPSDGGVALHRCWRRQRPSARRG